MHKCSIIQSSRRSEEAHSHSQQRKSIQLCPMQQVIWCGWLKLTHSAQCVLCKVRCHCIFYDAVSDTIRRRGGYRGIITEEGVDTVTYFGEIMDLEFENN